MIVLPAFHIFPNTKKARQLPSRAISTFMIPEICRNQKHYEQYRSASAAPCHLVMTINNIPQNTPFVNGTTLSGSGIAFYVYRNGNTPECWKQIIWTKPHIVDDACCRPQCRTPTKVSRNSDVMGKIAFCWARSLCWDRSSSASHSYAPIRRSGRSPSLRLRRAAALFSRSPARAHSTA